MNEDAANKDKLDIKDNDREFLKRLRDKMNRNKDGDNIYKIRNNFGRADHLARMALMSIAGDTVLGRGYRGNPDDEEETYGEDEYIYLLVAGLFYTVESREKIGKIDPSEMKKVNFEKLLSRLYHDENAGTQTTQDNIARFLEFDLDHRGRFIETFAMLAQRATRYIRRHERLNYMQLISDLRYWNNKNNYSKSNWGRAIFCG